VRKSWKTAGVLGVLVLAVGPLRAGDWPQFRGPGGRAVAEEIVPVRWSTTENVRWKADLPGRGVSGPVIAGGRVYVTAASGYRDGRLHVFCFDQVDGKKLWERQLAATGSTMCHPKTSMAAPTPVTDGKAVYCLFATGDLAAFDAAGNLLWYRSLVGDYPNVTNQVGMASSPIVHGDTLLLPLENAGDSFAAGIDKRTGRNKWRVERARDINWVTPVAAEINGQPCALFQTTQEITAYDPETGKVRWTFSGEGTSQVPSPVAARGMVYVAGKQYLALRPGPAGAAPEVVWRSNKVGLGYASPLYHEGRLYGIVGVGVNCVDAATGELVWQQRLTGPFWASPIIAGGRLYAVNEKGKTTVVQLGEKPKVLAANDLQEDVLATPAVADGSLFLRTDKHLYCIAEKKGR
jgi:outer membrane protein assembly factor BamB